jgi:hypothetical protein
MKINDKRERQQRLLSRHRLIDVLSYDPLSGQFTWIKPQSNRVRAGTVAGFKEHGYTLIGIDGAKFRAHRLAWLYVHGEWPKEDVDHRDRDRCNNAIANLREASRTQNNGNLPKRRDNISGYKGVRAHGKWWRAVITINHQSHHLGLFRRPEEAHEAYCEASKQLYGEFSRIS